MQAGARVLVTGANGFIGSAVAARLADEGYRVRAALRRAGPLPAGAHEAVVTGDLSAETDFSAALSGIDAVVHAAAIAHTDGVEDAAYARVNRDGTLALARAAQMAGIRRLVFLSSVRAQAGTVSGKMLTEQDEPAPTDAYGRSKRDAERGLASLDLDWVALRPVLVVGPGVKGNMAALARLARLPVPLPLAGLAGERSLVSLRGVEDAVLVALRLGAGLRRPYLVADPLPLSVPAIIAALRHGIGRPPGLFRVPAGLLSGAARLAGRADAFQTLAGSLVVDPSALISSGWRSPSVRDELARLLRPR